MKIVHDLSVGDPSDRPPKRLTSVLTRALSHGSASHYTAPVGLKETRGAITDYYRVQHGLTISSDDVAITQGARPAIYFSLRALERPEKPAAYFEPAYTAFRAQVINAGMTPTPVQLPEQRLRRANLRRAFAALRGGAFIFNNPHNPTGRIFDDAEIRVLCDVADEFDVRVISDFVYADLFQGSRPKSLLTIKPDAIEIVSLSKSFRACGWRVGAVVGDSEWVRRIVERYASLNGVPFAFQQVAAAAWSEMPGVNDFRLQLARRRKVMTEGLRSLGFRIDTKVHNRSGMFLWAALPAGVQTDAACHALERHGVLVTRGVDFGGGRENFIRISLNAGPGVLRDAVERISKALKEIQNVEGSALPARRPNGRAA